MITYTSKRPILLAGSFICLMISSPITHAANIEENFSFDLTITLSSKAENKLKSVNEGITVLASYYGSPHKGAERHANEMGMIDLGTETIELGGHAGSAHIKGNSVSSERLKWIQQPVNVNVNLFSSRKSSDDNILSCDLIDGPVNTVAKSPVTIHCALIEENTETKLKP